MLAAGSLCIRLLSAGQQQGLSSLTQSHQVQRLLLSTHQLQLRGNLWSAASQPACRQALAVRVGTSVPATAVAAAHRDAAFRGCLGAKHRGWSQTHIGQAAACMSTNAPSPDADEGGLQSLLEKQDSYVRRFVLVLVFGMMAVAAARVFPTMVQHNVRGTIAFLEAPDPAWQMQGVKSTQWVAKDSSKAQELLDGGAAGHLIAMLSEPTPPDLQQEALEAIDVIAAHLNGLEALVRAGTDVGSVMPGLVDALEGCPLASLGDDHGTKARQLLSAAKIQERHVD